MNMNSINKAINMVYNFSAAKNFHDLPHSNFTKDDVKRYRSKSIQLLRNTGMNDASHLIRILNYSPDKVEQKLWHQRYIKEGLVTADSGTKEPKSPFDPFK